MLRLVIQVVCLGSLLGCVGVVLADGQHRRRERSCHVPPGHLPPPGECRVWHPDRPPGQQPPPGSCYELERRVPPGACLVYGD